MILVFLAAENDRRDAARHAGEGGAGCIWQDRPHHPVEDGKRCARVRVSAAGKRFVSGDVMQAKARMAWIGKGQDDILEAERRTLRSCLVDVTSACQLYRTIDQSGAAERCKRLGHPAGQQNAMRGDLTTASLANGCVPHHVLESVKK